MYRDCIKFHMSIWFAFRCEFNLQHECTIFRMMPVGWSVRSYWNCRLCTVHNSYFILFFFLYIKLLHELNRLITWHSVLVYKFCSFFICRWYVVVFLLHFSCNWQRCDFETKSFVLLSLHRRLSLQIIIASK